jgi:HK97 family phage major capsid protein
MIKLSNTAETFRNKLIREMEDLSLKEKLTKQEDRRFETLKTQIAQISKGMDPSDLIGSDVARIEDEIRSFNGSKHQIPGLAEIDWRDWICGTAKRSYLRLGNEVRASQAVGSQSIAYTAGTAGGYFVPVGFDSRLNASMRQVDDIFDPRFHNDIETENGSPLVVPSFDDVSNQGQLVAENSQPPVQPDSTVTAANNVLNAYSFRSGLLYCSIETLQDSGVPIGALIERAFAVRLARVSGKYAILGTGSGQPAGLLTGVNATDAPEIIAGGSNSNDGISGHTGANSIGSQDLQDLFFGLNAAYRREAAFYLNDSTFQAISNVLDKNGRPLVKYNQDLANQPTIFGRPVAICPNLPSISPNAPTVLFGAPRYFYLRHVKAGSFAQMFTESVGTAEAGAVAFQGYFRTDSVLSVPNSTYPPFVQLVQHS